MFDRDFHDNIQPLANGAAYRFFNGRTTEIWPEEYYEAREPLGSLPGEASTEACEAWFAGHQTGYEEGYKVGTSNGFAQCQAGFRALLGAASAADVTTLLLAAQDAGRRP